MNVRDELFKLKDDKYKLFHRSLTNTKYPLIGIRLPFIKKLAKELSKENYDNYFNNLSDPYFEEVILEGLMIGYLKDINDVICKLRVFINKIDDWSVNDSLVSNLKITNKNKEIMWDFIIGYKDSECEFEVRFMIVMMMSYYLDKNHIGKIFEIINNIKCDKYYVKMAIAWLLATSVFKCEEETLAYLRTCNLDNFTFSKVISKCNDSFRVRDELKKVIKEIRK